MIAIALATLVTVAKPQVAIEAEDAYKAGRFKESAALFEKAYGEDPRDEYLWAWANSERMAGRCDRALPLYERYLATDPGAKATEFARGNIEECKSIVETEERAQPAAAATPTPTPPDKPSKRPLPWYADPLGGALVGVGVVSLAVGGGLYGRARADERAANEAGDVEDYGERIERAAIFSRAGIGLLAAGGVVLLAGVIRYAVLGSRSRRRAASRAQVGVLSVAIRF